MEELEKEELEAGARTAVLVRRSDLPTPLAHPARSYFGGLPKIPAEYDWPRCDVQDDNDGAIKAVALTFIAQIDLSEIPHIEESPLPETGTLYFFCSSIFCGEGNPPCRVLYYAGNANALPERAPPPDLMPLGGNDGEYQIKWLDPASDFHAKVEFKYPITFLPCRDFLFHDDPVGGELLTGALCEALGPGEPNQQDLLTFRRVDGYQQDPDWPFNWMLITHVARSIVYHVRSDLRASTYRKPLSDEAKKSLQDIETAATGWLDRSSRLAPLEMVDADAKEAYRAWWAGTIQNFNDMERQVSTYQSTFADDLGHAIDYNIKYMAAQGEQTLTHAPPQYIGNFEQRNHWKTPESRQGQHRFFWTAIHQMLGYGSSWQDAPAEHVEDVLLLQVQGDSAFAGWHDNCGCVLHFWIGGDALARLDFSIVEATLQCD